MAIIVYSISAEVSRIELYHRLVSYKLTTEKKLLSNKVCHLSKFFNYLTDLNKLIMKTQLFTSQRNVF